MGHFEKLVLFLVILLKNKLYIIFSKLQSLLKNRYDYLPKSSEREVISFALVAKNLDAMISD